jgi:L-threonylcarbamoyladenylate synthase
MARIISIDYPEAVPYAQDVIERGDLLVLPTDTVYGIGSALDEVAIARIFAAKRRPPERAVPVLLANGDAAMVVASAFPEAAQQLAAAFWPGPLTIVLPKRDDLPANLTTLPTVGVRVPDHDLAREVINAAGGALAVTSANLSDAPAACTIQEAIGYFNDDVALYLDDGSCPGGMPSTVAAFDADGTLRVLREGPISAAELVAVLAL